MHASVRDRPAGSYTVPTELSAPRTSADDPQVDGLCKAMQFSPDGVAD